MKKSILGLLLLVVVITTYSQNKLVDSLKNIIATTTSDTTKINTAVFLSGQLQAINIDSSIVYGKLAVDWSRKIQNDFLILRSLSMLSNALSERDIPASMQSSYAALALAKKINDTAAIINAYATIGLLHLYLGNSQAYIDYLKKATTFFAQSDPRKFQTYQEIGGAYVAVNKDSAFNYLNMAGEDSSTRNSAFYSYYWGRLLTTLNPSEALKYFKKSLDISHTLSDLRGFSLASRWFSIYYTEQGKLDSAIFIARNGLQAAMQLGFLRGIMNNGEQLTLAYKSLKNTDSAYKYLVIMDNARDSLFNQDKINKIQNAIINEQQKSQQLEDEKNKLQNRTTILSILAITILLFLAAIFFYNNQRRTQKSSRILQRQKDELNDKHTELQLSLEKLTSTQAQLIQSEKMASLGELTAGIAHEIQNPLNFVNNFSEVNKELLVEIKDEMHKGNYDEAKVIIEDVIGNEEKINHHGKRADAIVKGMLQHSRSSTSTKEPTDINKLADEYLRLAYHGLRAKDKSFNATLKTDYDESIGNINIIPQDIGRVILNLITNAFYAVAEKKKSGAENYEPTVFIATKKLNDQIEILVSDNGNGIPDTIIEKIFQPFFTTKPTGQGTGLGLSMSYDIVKGHGGELKVETKKEEGTSFIILLPTV